VHDRKDPRAGIIVPFDCARVGKEAGDPGISLDECPGLDGVKEDIHRARDKQIGLVLAALSD
jgi:hypothetical protein